MRQGIRKKRYVNCGIEREKCRNKCGKGYRGVKSNKVFGVLVVILS